MIPASFFIIIALTFIGLWVYCIADIAKSRFVNENNKLIYILVVVLAPVIGILLYLTLWQKEKVTIPRDI
ncbi:hypothetical protein AAU57_03360 [Nonlabens sp. YIK11]|uniref:PLDc N-terminal domain-containing protein n=1 Tax=Nonlabens sp. YIK11 TaxID=1453349 RepID=UPI0006DCC23E|nr:PLDc N-terminal domain-containing protein [Nonlabens sp. YIK11]KQC32476.1 hypothetical protein AAU57_03360 [Nonlabens sp. YIK11]